MEIQWWGVGAVAVVMAVVEVLKRLGLSTKLAPIAAILVAEFIGVVAAIYSGSVVAKALFDSLIVALTAIGAFSGVKNVREGAGGQDG